MLEIYLVALGIGGTLLVASILLGSASDVDGGADVDMDADVGPDADVHVADVDADAHVDGDADVAGGLDGLLSWMPITSMRFWTFFLAFFGLSGALLTGLGVMTAPAIGLGVSLGLGYVAGMSAAKIFRKLHKSQPSSSLSTDDYVGERGVVLVAISKEAPGKIRVQMMRRSVEMIAHTEDDHRFAVEDTVMVYAVRDDGGVMVTKQDQLGAGDGR